MKVAFYKYEFGNNKDWLIAKATNSQFSHVELIFDDGFSFSSSPRENGVRFKEIDYKEERWEFVELNLPIWKENYIIRKAKRIESYKYGYDWIAIYLHKIGIRSYGKFICSDLIADLLFDIMEFTTPQELYELVQKKK